MELSHYHGLIFDLDGTLVDSMPLHLAAWAHAAEQFGFEYDGPWLGSLGGVPGRKIARMLVARQQLTLDPAQIAAVKTDYYVSRLEQVSVFPSMLRLVKRYHGRIPMAIGTGSTRINVTRILENTGLARYFEAVITADDVTRHKPLPDTFLQAAAKLGAAPNQCLVFEDTPIGEQAALAAGMACQLVNEGQMTGQEAPVLPVLPTEQMVGFVT